MDRKRARQLSQSPPGRGITTGRSRAGDRHCLDRCCERRSAEDEIRRARRATDRAATGAGGPRDAIAARSRAQPVRRLRFCWASARPSYGPIAVDFAAESHLIVLGEGECGKTTALRTLCREIVRTNTADSAQLFIVDFRRTLLGVVESDHLAGYTPSAAALTSQLAALIGTPAGADARRGRHQQQLRTRSWWSGPEIYVVVDDYDLVAGAERQTTRSRRCSTSCRTPRISVCMSWWPRRSGGAARAMFDPVLGPAARSRVHGPDDERQPG